jgi:hypothetical protein
MEAATTTMAWRMMGSACFLFMAAGAEETVRRRDLIQSFLM